MQAIETETVHWDDVVSAAVVIAAAQGYDVTTVLRRIDHHRVSSDGSGRLLLSEGWRDSLRRDNLE